MKRILICLIIGLAMLSSPALAQTACNGTTTEDLSETPEVQFCPKGCRCTEQLGAAARDARSNLRIPPEQFAVRPLRRLPVGFCQYLRRTSG